MDKIVFTGGGSAGHVTPNIALIDALEKSDAWEIHYIGSRKGIERGLIEGDARITYHPISSGKFRRYFSLKNFVDPFKVLFGTIQAHRLLGKIKPQVIFSKGGFVSVPVSLAAKMRKIPLVVHESDMTPGLANKIATRYAKRVCTTFPETVAHFPSGKAIHTGTPVRSELFSGQREKGEALCCLNGEKPRALFMGGSLGAQAINQVVFDNRDLLCEHFQIVHICGQGNLPSDPQRPDYVAYEYVTEGLADLLAWSDITVSRAGANALSEFLALKKPSLLIPLTLQYSRGDQILNANSFEKMGYSHLLEQEEMTSDTLFRAMELLWLDRERLTRNMEGAPDTDGTSATLKVILETAKK